MRGATQDQNMHNERPTSYSTKELIPVSKPNESDLSIDVLDPSAQRVDLEAYKQSIASQLQKTTLTKKRKRNLSPAYRAHLTKSVHKSDVPDTSSVLINGPLNSISTNSGKAPISNIAPPLPTKLVWFQNSGRVLETTEDIPTATMPTEIANYIGSVSKEGEIYYREELRRANYNLANKTRELAETQQKLFAVEVTNRKNEAQNKKLFSESKQANSLYLKTVRTSKLELQRERRRFQLREKEFQRILKSKPSVQTPLLISVPAVSTKKYEFEFEFEKKHDNEARYSKIVDQLSALFGIESNASVDVVNKLETICTQLEKVLRAS